MRAAPRPISPDEWYSNVPFAFAHSSTALGWSGVRVEDEPDMPASEVIEPPLANLLLILHGRVATEGASLRCGEAAFEGTGSPQSLTVLPPGVESRWRWANACDCTQYHLTPALVGRVAQEAFDLDPARLLFPVVFYDRSHPSVLAAQAALRDELLGGGAGGRLCAESLATVLAVHLIRHLACGPTVRGLTGVLARHIVKAVEEFVMDNLDADLALSDLAAVAHLSEYHFARLFKATTGQTPHQFVIGKRVERAKHLITEGRLTLVQVAAEVGFASQSHLTLHFKRVVGSTPGQFRN